MNPQRDQPSARAGAARRHAWCRTHRLYATTRHTSSAPRPERMLFGQRKLRSRPDHLARTYVHEPHVSLR